MPESRRVRGSGRTARETFVTPNTLVLGTSGAPPQSFICSKSARLRRPALFDRVDRAEPGDGFSTAFSTLAASVTSPPSPPDEPVVELRDLGLALGRACAMTFQCARWKVCPPDVRPLLDDLIKKQVKSFIDSVRSW